MLEGMSGGGPRETTISEISGSMAHEGKIEMVLSGMVKTDLQGTTVP